MKGNGTTAKPTNYSFTDKDLSSGTFYYRLKQIDFNQNSQFTPVQSVKIQNGSKTISVFPNPTSDRIFIQNAANTEGGTLTDNSGRVVQSFKIVPSEINLEGLANGIYFLKIGSENFKIVKK